MCLPHRTSAFNRAIDIFISGKIWWFEEGKRPTHSDISRDLGMRSTSVKRDLTPASSPLSQLIAMPIAADHHLHTKSGPVETVRQHCSQGKHKKRCQDQTSKRIMFSISSAFHLDESRRALGNVWIEIISPSTDMQLSLERNTATSTAHSNATQQARTRSEEHCTHSKLQGEF